MFAESMPNYDKMSLVTKTIAGRDIDRHAMRTDTSSLLDQLATLEQLTDDEFMLTPPNLYGFSLADKEWCTSL